MWQDTETQFEQLRGRFQPVFARIAEDVAEREASATPPKEQLRWLVDAGFAAIRVPRSHGGDDAPLSTVFRLLTELASIDPNLAHIWRNHNSFLEDRRHDLDDSRTAQWFDRLGRGEIVGGGWSEPGGGFGPGGTELQTRLRRDDEGILRLDGVKYYSTGSIFARWITVLALDPEGEKVVALVGTDTPGVTVDDDWDGFGQQLTGSGSVHYRNVAVPDAHVFRYATRYVYQAQYYQSALNALLVGITQAILRDGARALRERHRSHGNASVDQVREDPELLGVIGALAVDAYAAETAFRHSLELVDRTVELSLARDGDDPGLAESLRSSWLAVASTQVLLRRHVLHAADSVFDALGASGTSTRLALDRHWRNARTLLSHNPWLYKQRIIGDWVVNGTEPAR